MRGRCKIEQLRYRSHIPCNKCECRLMRFNRMKLRCDCSSVQPIGRTPCLIESCQVQHWNQQKLHIRTCDERLNFSPGRRLHLLGSVDFKFMKNLVSIVLDRIAINKTIKNTFLLFTIHYVHLIIMFTEKSPELTRRWKST